MPNKNKKMVLRIIGVLMLVGVGLGVWGYQMIFASNVPSKLESNLVEITKTTTFDQLVEQLIEKDQIESENSFRLVAYAMRFGNGPLRNGRFEIEENWSNKKLIRHFQIGAQAPIKITFNNKRTIEELCGHLADYLILDSLELVDYLTNDDSLAKHNYTYETIMSLFIPNTYELFWNTDLKGFISRMKKENEAFWQKNGRLEKLSKTDLSREEAYTLASIIDKETNYVPEKPRVAGVYLNRLKKGIPLQADPTVVFATGDFTIRRVLNKHLEFDSPYNTYMYGGLPPGPIAMASISGIDAVLNAESHKYYYFCAKPGYGTEHIFAKTLSAHNKNANLYRRWLRSQNILR